LAGEMLHMQLPDSESATIGGFFMEHLNRVPQANDVLAVNGLEMIVESMERNRVLWIKARRANISNKGLTQ